MLKLHFLRRTDEDPASLLTAQGIRLELLLASLDDELASATGDQASLLRFRREIAHAGLRFVEGELGIG